MFPSRIEEAKKWKGDLEGRDAVYANGGGFVRART